MIIICQHLRLDATKIHEYDPATARVNEVIVSYPAGYAITLYRIANRLTRLDVPVRIQCNHLCTLHHQGCNIVIGQGNIIGGCIFTTKSVPRIHRCSIPTR